MTLAFNDDDRRKIKVTATASIDLGDCSIVLTIDDQPYPCTWSGPASETSGQWTRQAVTDGWFAGPAVPAGKVDGATILAIGTHTPEVIVEHPGGTIIAAVPPRFRITRT